MLPVRAVLDDGGQRAVAASRKRNAERISSEGAVAAGTTAAVPADKTQARVDFVKHLVQSLKKDSSRAIESDTAVAFHSAFNTSASCVLELNPCFDVDVRLTGRQGVMLPTGGGGGHTHQFMCFLTVSIVKSLNFGGHNCQKACFFVAAEKSKVFDSELSPVSQQPVLFQEMILPSALENITPAFANAVFAIFEKVRKIKLCECLNYLCLAGEDKCNSCVATDLLPNQNGECVICYEPAVHVTTCCKQPMHASCAGKTKLAASVCMSHVRCPHCRSGGFSVGIDGKSRFGQMQHEGDDNDSDEDEDDEE
jgi:hypothetical protein